MNSSSCETSGASVDVSSRVSDTGSRIHRFKAGEPDRPHTWDGVPVQEYKAAAAHHCGVSRTVLIGVFRDWVRRLFDTGASRP
jgi:hypothetical protein